MGYGRYANQVMSESSVRRSSGSGNGTFFGFLLVLAVLFGIVTAYAVRNNPLNLGDRNAYGISHYAFIDECRRELNTSTPTTVILQGQSVASNPLNKLLQDAKLVQPGETVSVETTATSREIVKQVHPIPENQEQGKKVVGLQWQTPVEVQANGSAGTRTLTPAVMQCQFDKAKGKAEVSMYISQ